MKLVAFVSVIEILDRNQSGAFCCCQMKQVALGSVAEIPDRNQKGAC